MTSEAHTSLLLVGAGHAHLYLMAHAQRLASAGYALTLLAPADFRYSGMASASATGHLAPDAGRLDVARLARSRGVHHIEGRLVDIDLHATSAVTDRGVALDWDVLSLNIGSVCAPGGIHDIEPGVVQVKPLADLGSLVSRLRRAHDEARAQRRAPRVTIVGGGSSGVELAGHLAAPGDVEVHLFEAGPSLAPALPPAARAHARTVLTRRGVAVHTSSPVRHLGTHRVELADGRSFEHEIALLATGLRADPLITELGLTGRELMGAGRESTLAGRTGRESTAASESPPRPPERPATPPQLGADRGGESSTWWVAEWGAEAPDGIPVSATLQYVAASAVYAAGDCAHFTPSPLPKIGVHGVRQGPVLLDSLIRRAAGASLPTYDPPRHPLQIVDLGGGVALAAKGQRWWCGRTSLLAKRWIDRRWLAAYRRV